MNTTTKTPSHRTTAAYYLQAILSFSIALGVVVIGEILLPVPAWTRAFLALGTLFLVSATFTLAKCVRDQQETESVVGRLDQARVERLLAEYDPFGGPKPADIPAPALPEPAPVGPVFAPYPSH